MSLLDTCRSCNHENWDYGNDPNHECDCDCHDYCKLQDAVMFGEHIESNSMNIGKLEKLFNDVKDI